MTDIDNDDELLYGISLPARNVPELATATISLIDCLNELNNKDEGISHITKHLDLYVKNNPLKNLSFNDAGIEWFNVSKPLVIEDLNSHIVVLDFFTYCCINCLHILPDLNALEEKYKPNSSPVIIIGIHSAKFDNERVSKCVENAIKRHSILHPVLNDVKCKIWNNHGICCWPTLLIAGPGGLPLFVLMGEGNKDYLFQFVDETIRYFEKSRKLDPKLLPLAPFFHVSSEESSLYYPGKIATYDKGLIISDSGNNRLLLTSYDGEVQDVIGSGEKGFDDGSYYLSSFNNPQGAVFHPSGVIFVADTENHAIRKIDLKLRKVETIAGNGLQGMDRIGGEKWKEQVISSPWDICLVHSPSISPHAQPDLLLIAMAGLHQIWGLFLNDALWIKNRNYEKGSVVCLAGSGQEENRNTAYPLKAGFAQPSGICAMKDTKGDIAIIADSESSSVRQFSCVDGAVKRVAGGSTDPTNLFAYGDKDGMTGAVRFQHPLGVSTFEDKIYVADTYNHKVKVLKKEGKTFVAETLLGDGNGGNDLETSNTNLAVLNEPGGLCISEDGSLLFIADTNNSSIKKLNLKTREIVQLKLDFSHDTSPEESEDTVDSREYQTLLLPSEKVQVKLKICLKLPSNLHLTPEAPLPTYTLGCTGSVYECESEENMTRLISVDLSEEEIAEVSLTWKLFLCSDEGKCFMKKGSINLTFLRNENETKSDYSFDVQIKPL